jgi:hypothetical protein
MQRNVQTFILLACETKPAGIRFRCNITLVFGRLTVHVNPLDVMHISEVASVVIVEVKDGGQGDRYNNCV